MNASPTWMIGLQWLGVLSAEVALAVAGAALLQRFTTSAWWRRTVWQVCSLSLLALPLTRRWSPPAWIGWAVPLAVMAIFVYLLRSFFLRWPM